MPGSARREHAGASVRAPSTSTTHTLHAFFGVSVSPWHRVGTSLPADRQASRIVEPSGTRVSWPSSVNVTRRRGG